MNKRTIIASASAPGRGGVSVVRMSGEKSKTIAERMCGELSEPWKFKKCSIMSSGDGVIDSGMVVFFQSPHSYTGEDVIEIACHGSAYIIQKIISCFLEEGVLPAQAGEFTLRAYLNKKMDLSQAEAVADIIASESAEAHRIAMQQMRGGFSKGMEVLRQQLIQFKALIELELDFSEEEVNFADKSKLESLLKKLQHDISELKNSFAYGNVIKKGVPVAIAGKPNVGKSSLLNALFNEDKAIVSPIAGTTRDSIEDTLIIDGVQFRFIDTAGLRQTDDIIESIGVQKAKEKVIQATVLLYLYDKSATVEDLVSEIKSLHHEKLHLIVIQNKIDLDPKGYDIEFSKQIAKKLDPKINLKLLGITTIDKTTLGPLKTNLLETVQSIGNNSALVINNSRHYHALNQALASIEIVKEGLKNDLSGDLLSIELKEAIEHIGTITGVIDTDQDVLGAIFSQFCIGK